jgi:uncharacterized membrane protein YfhO
LRQRDNKLTALVPDQDKQFRYRFTTWNYNHMDLTLTAANSGWVYLQQLYDPNWVVKIDGKNVNTVLVNYCFMAAPLAKGEHALSMTFQPLSRKIYPWARWLLYASLLSLALAGVGTKRAAAKLQNIMRNRA